MLRSADVATPVFFVDEVVGTFLTLDQAVRSVDPQDLPQTHAYDARGRALVLKQEGRHAAYDEWASGEERPDELRARLVAFGREHGLTGDLDRMDLPDLVAAYETAFTLPARPTALVWAVGVVMFVGAIVLVVLLW